MNYIIRNIFGHKKKKKQPAVANSGAIQKILEIEELLRRRQRELETKKDEELKTAKFYGSAKNHNKRSEIHGYDLSILSSFLFFSSNLKS